MYLPSSPYQHISKLMDLVVNLNPGSVLDIGPGFGKYGLLCREYLELWDGRQNYSEFLRRIDCIEVFENYITPLHKFVYNNVYIKDILELVDQLNFSYDLVLLIDVLEHFDKEKGRSLLTKILANNKGVLISTPKNPSNQKDAFGNIYETHKAKWTKKELSDIKRITGMYSFSIPDSTHLILYIGESKSSEKLRRRLLILRHIKKIPGMRHILPVGVRSVKKFSAYIRHLEY
jgi:hypothetical protein